MFNLLGQSEKDVISNDLFKKLGTYEKQEYEDSYHAIFEKKGLELLFDLEKGVLDSIFIKNTSYSRNKLGTFFSENINFSMNRSEIRQNLGNPNDESDPNAKTLLGPVQPWDLFFRPNYKLHVQYALVKNKINIEMFTLSLV